MLVSTLVSHVTRHMYPHLSPVSSSLTINVRSPPKDVEQQGSNCSGTAAHPTAVTVSLTHSAGAKRGVGSLADLQLLHRSSQ